MPSSHTTPQDVTEHATEIVDMCDAVCSDIGEETACGETVSDHQPHGSPERDDCHLIPAHVVQGLPDIQDVARPGLDRVSVARPQVTTCGW